MVAIVRAAPFVSEAQRLRLLQQAAKPPACVSGQAGADRVWLALRQSTGLTLGAVWEPTYFRTPFHTIRHLSGPRY